MLRKPCSLPPPDAPSTEKVIVQAIRIGDQAIVSMPFEVLVEIGLEIKDKSSFQRTFLIETSQRRLRLSTSAEPTRTRWLRNVARHLALPSQRLHAPHA